MKKTFVAIAALMVSVAAYGQSASVLFNTSVSGSVDAPVARTDTLPNLITNPTGIKSTGGGAGLPPAGGPVFQARLALVGAGGALTPVGVASPFRQTSAGASYYVNAGAVDLPGVTPGGNATVRFLVYDGADFASSVNKGFSDIALTGIGGGLLPASNLNGLQGFTITIVPEPSTLVLGALGLGALLIRRRK